MSADELRQMVTNLIDRETERAGLGELEACFIAIEALEEATSTYSLIADDLEIAEAE